MLCYGAASRRGRRGGGQLRGREVVGQEAAGAPTGRPAGNWEEARFFDQFRVVSTNFDQFRPKNI